MREALCRYKQKRPVEGLFLNRTDRKKVSDQLAGTAVAASSAGATAVTGMLRSSLWVDFTRYISLSALTSN